MKNFAFAVLCGVALAISCRNSTQPTQNNGTVELTTITTAPSEVNGTNKVPVISELKSPNNGISSQIGTIESDANSVCLRIENPNLGPGDTTDIIITETPQKIFREKVLKIGGCEPPFGDLSNNSSEYLLSASETGILSQGYGIGIVNSPNSAKLVKGLASMDINNDGKPEFFRECTSNEGLHLTVWTDKPLIGKRIWHSYYHFNYDTESTCQKKDYEGTHD